MHDHRLPAGSVDTHIHFYDGRWPSAPSALLHPPDASVDDYLAFRDPLGADRVVVVQPTTYGLDNGCQLEAMEALGDGARGVMVVDESVTDAELAELTARGVRGARFHMLPGGAVGWDSLESVARSVAEHGWHIQLQLNGCELTARYEDLAALPCDLVVDHVGRFMPPVEPDDLAFVALRRLVAGGRCWVKLSAPYESSVTGPPGFDDVARLAQVLVADNPERMLWASNWPHPGQAAPPSGDDLVALIRDWTPDETILRRIMVDNPVELYGF